MANKIRVRFSFDFLADGTSDTVSVSLKDGPVQIGQSGQTFAFDILKNLPTNVVPDPYIVQYYHGITMTIAGATLTAVFTTPPAAGDVIVVGWLEF